MCSRAVMLSIRVIGPTTGWEVRAKLGVNEVIASIGREYGRHEPKTARDNMDVRFTYLYPGAIHQRKNYPRLTAVAS